MARLDETEREAAREIAEHRAQLAACTGPVAEAALLLTDQWQTLFGHRVALMRGVAQRMTGETGSALAAVPAAPPVAAGPHKGKWPVARQAVHEATREENARKSFEVRNRITEFLEVDACKQEDRFIEDLAELTVLPRAYIRRFIWWGPKKVPARRTLASLADATEVLIAKYEAEATQHLSNTSP